MIKYSYKLIKGAYIDTQEWINLLVEHTNKLFLRQRELLKIKKALDERGQTIEQALMTIKCSEDKIENLGIELSDMA